jgi:glycosyltransferase involved in cell wall biosynthesis
MKIGVDATIVRGDRISGMERYTIELIKALAQISKDVRFQIFIHPNGHKFFQNLPDNFEILTSPFKNRILTEQVWLPYIINKSDVKLAHLTTLGPSFFIRKNSIITIHDAIPWKFKETLSRGMKYYYKPLLSYFVRKNSPKIITVSDSSKNDLKEIFTYCDNDINVIYIGRTQGFIRQSENKISEIKEKYSLPDSYILTYGTLEPRKNVKKLISAFREIKSEINEKLVIVGRRGWQEEFNIDKELEEDIYFTGFVEDVDLVKIVAGANLFVFPSLYEGFGLPLIEAQGCGVPTIVSNNSSLIEVGLNSTGYFNPNSEIEIGTSILKLLNDHTRMSELSQLGYKNVERFTWEKTALETLETYKEVLFGGKNG